jgi:hypothetical protein
MKTVACHELELVAGGYWACVHCSLEVARDRLHSAERYDCLYKREMDGPPQQPVVNRKP